MAILSGVSDVRAEQEESTLKVAMIAKTAAIAGCGRKPEPVIITAGETGVFFAYSENMHAGFKFTVDEWREIIDFVGQQIVPVGAAVADESWQPDWSKIHEQFFFWAVDEDRWAWVYVNEPTINDRNDAWHPTDSDYQYERIRGGKITLPNNIDWKQTLRKRPGV